MIRQDAVGQDAHPTERLVLAHELAELFPLHIPKDKLPVHHAGNEVVIRHQVPHRCL